jgi:hypothetical protein
MLGPKNPDSPVCWCLSHRVDYKINRQLVGPARAEFVRELCSRADNAGRKVDLTMAYVGTRKLFEQTGFTKAADTDSVSGGFPRLDLR